MEPVSTCNHVVACLVLGALRAQAPRWRDVPPRRRAGGVRLSRAHIFLRAPVEFQEDITLWQVVSRVPRMFTLVCNTFDRRSVNEH